MIAVEELRKGNMLYVDGNTITEVTVIGEDFLGTTKTYGYINQVLFKPIPLTPEILEMCGFEKENEVWWDREGQFQLKEDSEFAESNDKVLGDAIFGNTKGIKYTWWFENTGGHMKFIIYLHQLQNLFWCLVGEELEINPQFSTQTTKNTVP